MEAGRVRSSGWLLVAVALVCTVVSTLALDLRLDALHSAAAAGHAIERAASFARGFIHPDLSVEAITRSLQLAMETLAVGVVGTALGAAAGLGIGVLASTSVAAGGHPRPRLPARVGVAVARTVLDILRAIPDFAWALMLLVPLGPGPVTGALAIALTVTGVLGRTYGQLVDAVPHAQVRAVETLGANRTAMAVYGRLPRVAASAWSYTLVRLECSVRNASVIGVVGGGGLGAELFEELGYGRDDRVATLLLTLLLLTAAADLGASWTRRRLAGVGAGPPRRVRQVMVAAAVALGLSVAVLLPAIVETAGQIAIDDHGFAAASLGQLLRPDLGPTTLVAAFASAAIPLATTWLATLGSVMVALTVLPMCSSDLTRRAAGPGTAVGWRWTPVLVGRGAALIARAVPDVAWLLLLAAALRMGHLAAVVALMLHSTGVLIRVFSETVDDDGVRDPVHGPGGRIARLAYRIIPRVRSTMVTHTVLQAESNLRAAIVLGIVGAGGLGDAFHSAITFWRLPQASTMAIVMVIVFIAVDRVARRGTTWSVGRATTAPVHTKTSIHR